MNKKQFKVSFIDRLTQFNFAMLTMDVINILDANAIDYPLIGGALSNLKKHNKQLRFFGMQPNDNSISQELKELDELRVDYFVALKGVVRARLKSNNPVERDAAQTLTDWIDRYKKYLSINTRYYITLGIRSLESEREIYKSVDLALEYLGLKSLFADLVEISIKSTELTIALHKPSENFGEAAIEFRKEVTFDLKRLLRAVDALAMIDDSDTEEVLRLRNTLLFTLEGYRIRNLQRIAATKRGKKWKEREERKKLKRKGRTKP